MVNRWALQANGTWQVRQARGYSATITYTGAGATPYQLVISPGAVTTTHVSLKRAKEQFRLFLADKPVT